MPSKSLLLAAALASASATPAALFSEDSHAQKYMFDTFVREYSKQYSSPEERQSRFSNFVQNLKLADARNVAERKNNGTAVHGISRFMDLSQQEFSDNYLGARRPTDTKASDSLKTVRTSVGVTAGAGSSVDWAGVLTTPVKDQVGAYANYSRVC